MVRFELSLFSGISLNTDVRSGIWTIAFVSDKRHSRNIDSERDRFVAVEVSYDNFRFKGG